LRRITVLFVTLALVAGITPMTASAAATHRPQTPTPKAVAGRDPAKAKTPFTSLPYHGLKKGQRTPVEPPPIRATGGRAAAKTNRIAPRDGGGGPGPPATNLRRA